MYVPCDGRARQQIRLRERLFPLGRIVVRRANYEGPIADRHSNRHVHGRNVSG